MIKLYESPITHRSNSVICDSEQNARNSINTYLQVINENTMNFFFDFWTFWFVKCTLDTQYINILLLYTTYLNSLGVLFHIFTEILIPQFQCWRHFMRDLRSFDWFLKFADWWIFLPKLWLFTFVVVVVAHNSISIILLKVVIDTHSGPQSSIIIHWHNTYIER